jgi:hypothetical protein
LCKFPANYVDLAEEDIDNVTIEDANVMMNKDDKETVLLPSRNEPRQERAGNFSYLTSLQAGPSSYPMPPRT